VRDGTLAVTLTRPWRTLPSTSGGRSGKAPCGPLPVLAVGFCLATVFVVPAGYLRACPSASCSSCWASPWHHVDARDRPLAFWLEESPGLLDRAEGDLHPRGLFLPIDFFPPGLAAVRAGCPSPSRLLPAITMVNFGGARSHEPGRRRGMAAVLAGLVALLFAAGRRRVHAQGDEMEPSVRRFGSGFRLLDTTCVSTSRQHEYRASFITQVLGMVLNNASFIVFWLILFERLGDIRGMGSER